MSESNLPLIKAERLTTTESKWKLLLKLDNDPNRTIHIQDIRIALNDVTTFQPYIKVLINGTPYLREFAPVEVTTRLNFGGKLAFKGKTDKPPIEIYVKSDGTNTLNATCLITGIITPY